MPAVSHDSRKASSISMPAAAARSACSTGTAKSSASPSASPGVPDPPPVMGIRAPARGPPPPPPQNPPAKREMPDMEDPPPPGEDRRRITGADVQQEGVFRD